MARVYKYRDYYIAGVEHVVPNYFQDVVFIYNQNNRWESVSAERLRTNDATLSGIRDAVKYVTHVDDLTKAITELKRRGISIEEVERPPFPRHLIEGKKKIQAEFD